jgi:DNA-binding winged helix-turn-helix (wHTH) protein/Tol biopolymer transport system component
MIVSPRRALVSFGTFEVDLDTGEIRKAGLRVRLAAQPFRVLAALLTRPGEIITREVLQQEVWGTNTNVDFERGIASAINKIREALGDSADQPRYIETLARRGYRFIAPVSVGRDQPSSPVDLPASAHLSLPASQLSIKLATQDFDAVAPPAAPNGISDGISQPSTQQPAANGFSGLHLRSILLLSLAALVLVSLTAITTLHFERPESIYGPPRIEQLTQNTNIYLGPPNPETLLAMASDGPRLYAPLLVNGRSQISSLDLNGRQIQPVNMPDELGSVAITDISRDGSKLMVRSLRTREPEQPLWIVPTTGSGALRVGEVVAHDATWMPNNSGVLYASGNALAVIQLDTGTVSPFLSLPGRAFWLRWSPNNELLRFTLLDPLTHSSSLWELDAATQRPHPLRFPELHNLDLCCGSWTASGDLYVFQASDARSSNLWAIGTGAGARPMELTNGPLRFMFPLPSGEGRSIFAFGLAQPAGTRLYDRTLRQFVPAPDFLADAERVSYSRDGAWVAWNDTSGRLWRAKSHDGSGLLRLTGDDLEVFLAQWAPNGQQLLLMARKPGETWKIYTVNAAGGAIHLVLGDHRNLADPGWSADGRQIVFGWEADLMGKEGGPHNIKILDLPSQLVRSLPGSTDLFSPRWSPDGLWVAALSRDQAKLVVYSVRDQTWRTLFTSGAADPVWSADSRAIYFHAFADPDSAILRVSLDGTRERVADLSQMGLPAVNSYFFGGMTPDGSPIIEPRVGTGNIYSIALPPAPGQP